MFVIIIELQPASISSAICGLYIPVKDLNILNKVVVVVVVLTMLVSEICQSVNRIYLGSLSFSFLDFSDDMDALDLSSSDRFIFLG